MRRRKAGQRLAEYNQQLESYRRPGRSPQSQQYSNYEPSSNYNTSSNSESTEGEVSTMPGDPSPRKNKQLAHREFVRRYGNDRRRAAHAPSGEMFSSPPTMSTPASDMTRSGSMDVDDSPMKQAEFIGNYGAMNRVSQKDYSDTSSIADNAIRRADERTTVDLAALDKRIKDREMYSRAKADKMGLDLFGDMYKYTAPDYQQPEPEKPVETPDFENLYDKYKDDLDDD